MLKCAYVCIRNHNDRNLCKNEVIRIDFLFYY